MGFNSGFKGLMTVIN